MKITSFDHDGQDSHDWEIVATDENTGLQGKGYGRDYFKAETQAIQDLQAKLKKNLSPVLPNWENTPEANLARVSLLELCCVDFSPFMV